MQDRDDHSKHAGTVVSVFETEIVPERLSYYLERLRIVAGHSARESGLERCEVFNDPECPNKIMIVDVFADDLAYQEHLKQDYLRIFQEEVTGCAAGPSTHRVLRLVDRGKNTTAIVPPAI